MSETDAIADWLRRRFYYLTPAWWGYILAPIHPNQKICDPWWWVRIPRCRWRGHPAGVVWYNTGGLEPDMTCRECGDDLG